MENFERLVQSCIDFVLPTFKKLALKDGNVFDEPIEEGSFPAELLQLKWPCVPENEVTRLDVDALIVLVLKRVISDSLVPENETNEAVVRNGIQQAAVVLDFCFHSRGYRQNPATWSNSFFALFSLVVDSLSWPRGLIEFWPYAESRIEWFKMCNSLDPVPVGASNLVSYKQPLYDKLRHWNDLLTMVQNNNYLNTPLHYEMKYKVEKFLSELLPISEESNFNRSAMFSTKLSSANPWNKTISSATKTDLSSENVFATDFNHVYNNLIMSPLEFIYKPQDFKTELDETLESLLDAILESEEEFYKRIKVSHKMVSSINDKLNHDFPMDFEVTKTRVPNYMKISQKTNQERQTYWKKFLNLEVSLSSLLQPTAFDTSVSNPFVLYDQIMDLENDYFRKQFILQVCFTLNLIKQIVTLPDVENFYKSCYQKERPSRSIKFDNSNESNRKRTTSLCEHFLNNRLNKFYHNRDPLFTAVIQRVLKADESYLKSKMDGFKIFNSFVIPPEKIESPKVDYSFKKFGFVLLGNKSINNVWKIKTGLHEIEKCSSNAKEVYEGLHNKWSSEEADNDDLRDNSGEKIIKEWQIMRRLRSQYLFDFNRVDETVGINGLFDSSSETENASRKRHSIESMVQKLREPHLRQLEAARKFNEEKLNRKRGLEEEKEHVVVKQRKLNEDEANPTDFTSEEDENTKTYGNKETSIVHEGQQDEQVQDLGEQSVNDDNQQNISREKESDVTDASPSDQSSKTESPKNAPMPDTPKFTS